MNKKQWVQHISGQGEKWLVVYGGDPIDWMVLCKATDGERNRALPKSEYRLCDPPEVWRDVTGECRVDDYSNRSGDFWSILHVPTGANVMSKCNDGYRFRKVPLFESASQGIGVTRCAFIVEQKVKS